MKKNIAGLSLTLVTNDQCEMMMAHKTMNGALVVNENDLTANFTESAPKPSRQRNTKVYDGTLLSMVVKENGTYQVHTKTFNPLMVKDFARKISKEAKELLQKAEGK